MSDGGFPAAKLTRSDARRLRAALEQEQAKILRSLDRHLDGAIRDEAPIPDEMDLATRSEEQAYLLRLADKERKLLLEIQRALGKMREGTYGLCEGTDEPIGLRRLEARPWARYSVRYKEELEREERKRGK